MIARLRKSWTMLALALGGVAAADVAYGALRVCNHSGVATTFAVAERSGASYVARGWWRVEPNGACQTLVRGALRDRYYFVYGFDDEGMEVAGDDRFCVIANRHFSTLDADRRCEGPAREWRDFVAVDTGHDEDFTFEVYDFHLTSARR